MKLNDVANQLRLLIPQYTTKFSTFLAPSSITSNGTTATLTFASPHGMTTGQYLIFSGIGRRTPISSFTKDGLIFTFVTGSNHDLTMNWYSNPNDRSTAGKVVLGGFTNAVWNGSKTLRSTPNRRNFTLQSNAADPVLTGSEYVVEIEASGLVGAKQVTVINSTTLTVTGSISAGTYEGGTVSQMPRISVAVTAKDAWDRIITPQQTNNFSMVVLPIDPVISKDRRTLSDAIASRTQGEEFRLKLLDGFMILIIAPSQAQLSGAVALDICRHDLRSVIYKSIMGVTLPTGTSDAGDYKVIPVNDGVISYDGSKLIYQYTFQYPIDLTLNDTVPPGQTAAFRDIEYSLEEGDGLNLNIDLDDEPLE